MENRKKQLGLFSEELSEWVGMPEFIQEKVEPFSAIIIRFETEQDLLDFSEVIGQKLTAKTKSIWHPHKPHSLPNKKMYYDES